MLPAAGKVAGDGHDVEWVVVAHELTVGELEPRRRRAVQRRSDRAPDQRTHRHREVVHPVEVNDIDVITPGEREHRALVREVLADDLFGARADVSAGSQVRRCSAVPHRDDVQRGVRARTGVHLDDVTATAQTAHEIERVRLHSAGERLADAEQDTTEHRDAQRRRHVHRSSTRQ